MGNVVDFADYRWRKELDNLGAESPDVDEELRGFAYFCLLDQSENNLEDLLNISNQRLKDNPKSAAAHLGVATYQLLNEEPEGYESINKVLDYMDDPTFASDCCWALIERINRNKMHLLLPTLERAIINILSKTPNYEPGMLCAQYAAQHYLGKSLDDIFKQLYWSKQ